jgi:hypothetical protein
MQDGPAWIFDREITRKKRKSKTGIQEIQGHLILLLDFAFFA